MLAGFIALGIGGLCIVAAIANLDFMFGGRRHILVSLIASVFGEQHARTVQRIGMALGGVMIIAAGGFAAVHSLTAG